MASLDGQRTFHGQRTSELVSEAVRELFAQSAAERVMWLCGMILQAVCCAAELSLLIEKRACRRPAPPARSGLTFSLLVAAPKIGQRARDTCKLPKLICEFARGAQFALLCAR